jgi:hypothetical protein
METSTSSYSDAIKRWFGNTSPTGCPGRRSAGNELEYAAFTFGEPPDGSVIERGDEAGNDGGVESGPAGSDTFGGGEELGDF